MGKMCRRSAKEISKDADKVKAEVKEMLEGVAKMDASKRNETLVD